MTNPNYQTDLPAPIKAKITQFENAHRELVANDYCPAGSPADIQESYDVARYNLERTILTFIDRAAAVKFLRSAGGK